MKKESSELDILMTFFFHFSKISFFSNKRNKKYSKTLQMIMAFCCLANLGHCSVLAGVMGIFGMKKSL